MKSHIHAILRCSAAAAFALTGIAHAGLTLYSNSGSIAVNEANISLPDLNVARTSSATDTLYFKYTVTNPASNYTTENYFAGMSFYDGVYADANERLGVGNGWGAWAYSAFGTANTDLNNPDPPTPGGHTVKLVESTDTTTFFFKIKFNSAANDNVTVWLNPNQATVEGSQSSALTTTFNANSTFTNIFLREGGGGSGWTFSNIAIAGSFGDLSTNTSIKAPETQVFTTDVAVSSKSIFEWNLDGNDLDGKDRSTRGTGGYDAVNIAGNLTGSGAAFKVLLHNDSFTNTFWNLDRQWNDIFKANADGSGSAFNIAGLFSSITGDGIVWDSINSRGNVADQGYFTLNGTSLNWTAVPELSNVLIGGLLGAGLLRRRRKA